MLLAYTIECGPHPIQFSYAMYIQYTRFAYDERKQIICLIADIVTYINEIYNFAQFPSDKIIANDL